MSARTNIPTLLIEEAVEEARSIMLQKDSFCVAAGAASSAWWLIARTEGDGRSWEALTVDHDGMEALAVFSFREEAEMLLKLQGLAGGWQIRESRAGELTSVLRGPCSGTEGVVLDPLPEMATDRTLGLVWVDREAFLDRLLSSAKSIPDERG